MSTINPKFVELAAEVVRIFLLNTRFPSPLREVPRGVAQGHILITTAVRTKTPLREVPRGVAQGHILITTAVRTKKTCPKKTRNSHFTRSISWVYSLTVVLLALFGHSI